MPDPSEAHFHAPVSAAKHIEPISNNLPDEWVARRRAWREDDYEEQQSGHDWHAFFVVDRRRVLCLILALLVFALGCVGYLDYLSIQ